jgi:Fe-S-cluster containining protein
LHVCIFRETMMAKNGLCSRCEGTCCKYVALPIDTPKTKADFDDIRWYLAHKGVSVFVEKGDWYINFATSCRHLHPKEHSCDIYKKRPRICKSYRTNKCDMTAYEYDYELHFTDDAQMEEYIKVKFTNNKVPKRPKRKKK